MLFSLRKSKPKSISHPLGKIPDLPSEIPHIKYLLEQLRAGDANVIEEITLGYLRLAFYLVGQYANAIPNKVPDLISEAVVGIIQACHKISVGVNADDDITRFVSNEIHSAIRKYLQMDSLITVPESTYYKYKKLGKPLIKPGIEPLRNNVLSKYSNLFDLKELIDKSIETELERKIIDLRSKKYTDLEIGQELNLDASYIAKIRKTVEARFDKLYKG